MVITVYIHFHDTVIELSSNSLILLKYILQSTM